MTGATVIFVDTNFFLSCRKLDKIDWTLLGPVDAARLLICETVVSEIDELKTSADRRKSRKAMQTNTYFGHILNSSDKTITLNESAPKVTMEFYDKTRPSQEHVNELDYDNNDQRIIGYVLDYSSHNESDEVVFVTGDTVARWLASNFNVDYLEIPAEWLLPERPDPRYLENQRLKKQLAELRSTEPNFAITCLDENGGEPDQVEFSYPRFEPLDETQIESLMERLKTRHPMKTDFGAPNPRSLRSHATIADLLGQRLYEPSSYVRPPDEKIRRYTEFEYPAWINNCRRVLSKLDELLQSNLDHSVATFAVSNDSNSTGRNVLIRFVAHEGILIRPHLYVPDSAAPNNTILPEPPTAPEGYFPAQRVEQAVRQTLGRDSHLATFNLPIAPPYTSVNNEREPDCFYYKNGRSEEPSTSFELTCEQWRHRDGNAYFEAEILFDPLVGLSSGKIGLEIHADNLPRPARKFVPISIVVKPENSEPHAMRMINSLRFDH